jgi:predicted Zn-dependent peptidase
MKKKVIGIGLIALMLLGFIFLTGKKDLTRASEKAAWAGTKAAKNFLNPLEGVWTDESPARIWFPQQAMEKEISGDDEEFISEQYFIPDLNITHIVLKNGLRVCLKPTEFETDEVMIKFAAKGGYGSLSIEDRPSGELASQIAWESGMGGLTSDQMSVFLYEHSLDLAIKIKAFSREIEGTASTEGIKAFFDAIRVTFKQPVFTEEGKAIALALAAKAISRADDDYEQMYESVFSQVNAPDEPALKPLNLRDLKSVDLKKSEKFFHECFEDPADFICVVVGSFDLATTKKIVARSLGRLSQMGSSKDFKTPRDTPFPPGITSKLITLQGQNDCLTRVTLPLQIAINDQSIHLVEFICQIMEARIRNVLVAKMKYSYGIDVSYEFPLYPYLNNPWISIRYRSSEQHVNMLKHLILSELGLLQTKGATESEIEAIRRYQSNSEEYWLQDNFYWMSVLANYYLWGWDPLQIINGETEVNKLPLPVIDRALKNSFILGNYSVVTAKP